MIVQPNSTKDVAFIREETSELDLTAQEDNTSACITEEWEKLIVNEVSEIHSPVCTSKPKLDQSLLLSPPDGHRQLDAKTSRILERLEVPRQFKRESVSPILANTGMKNFSVEVKKPLVESQPNCAPHQSMATTSQLMKPNFQRLKRKHK